MFGLEELKQQAEEAGRRQEAVLATLLRIEKILALILEMLRKR